jgi:hypothetical protein
MATFQLCYKVIIWSTLPCFRTNTIEIKGSQKFIKEKKTFQKWDSWVKVVQIVQVVQF